MAPRRRPRGSLPWLVPGLLCALLAAGCTIRVNRYFAADGSDAAPGDAGAADSSGESGQRLLADDLFRDFHAGTLSESGAKIYVAHDGSVRLLEGNDLDRDGTIDIVFSNDYNNNSHTINSFIYHGSSAGYSASNRRILPTVGAVWNVVRDLDLDGYPEILFSNYYDGTSHLIDSYIYRGSASGYTPTSRLTLATRGAWGSSVADLDHDGYLDVVVSNNRAAGNSNLNSYIYWGSGAGFSAQKRQQVPTQAAHENCVADLDHDGHLDIVFANQWNGSSYKVNSSIYWGSRDGYSSARRQSLPTLGAVGCAVADLNADGRLDLVFANYYSGSSYNIDSYIYWGDSKGFSTSRRSGLPTVGARAVSAADLDLDGELDLVFSNSYDGTSYQVGSYIYRGQGGGYSTSRRQALPTMGCRANAAVDLNGDGYPELIFANRYNGTSHQLSSYIYWGSNSGHATTRRTELSTMGAAHTNLANLGTVSRRSPVHSFSSRALDSGSASASYQTLSWKATVPANTGIKLQLRSATSAAGLAQATWYGPASTQDAYLVRTFDSSNPAASSAAINQLHRGQRFIQYRASFSSSFGAGPVLDRVAISLP